MLRVSPGSITTDPAARGGPRRDQRGFGGPHRVEQFGAGDEHHAGAHHRQQDARIARIDFHVMAAAFDRADGDRVDYQKRLEAGLDGEQAGETL